MGGAVSVELETAALAAGLPVEREPGPSLGLDRHPDGLGWWAERVQLALGLHYPPARWGQLERALTLRMGLFGLDSPAAYRELVLARPVEWRGLADELTVNETSFFRRPETFEALSERILPEVVAGRRRSGELRIKLWSAGCSTGEEAYSLAIVAGEVIDHSPQWELEVLGTDLSQAAIRRAGSGMYRASRLSEIAAERLERYFQAAPGDEAETAGLRLRAKPALRSLVQFRVHNLTNPAWPSDLCDVILCQNVLMYLCPDLRATVLQRLFRSLATPGYLIVGPADLPAEPLFGGVRPFNCGGALVYRRS